MSVNTYDKMFYKGPESALPEQINDGAVLFTTDTGRIFLENSNNERIEISDFIKGMTEEEIKAQLAPIDSKVYIASDTHRFMTYDSTQDDWTNVAVVDTDTEDIVVDITRDGFDFIATRLNGSTFSFNQQQYTGENGININGTTISNSGVRDIATGSTSGTINVNTNGTTADIAVHGLQALAYKASLGKGDVGLSNVANLDQSKAIKSITRSGTTFTATAIDGTTSSFTQQDNNTTYAAGTGIALNSGTFSNSGVRAAATGTTNGTININTNGSTADVAVKGLAALAYKASLGKSDVGLGSVANLNQSKAIKSITRSGTTFTATALDGTTSSFTQQDNNTTYTGANGISLSGTTFSNSGVRSIAKSGSAGYINVNTNGTTANVEVNGAPKAVKSITRSGTTFTATCLDGSTFSFTQQDNNTTYTANNGVTLSGTTFSNSGVRSIATGTSNGTINVNTNGTTANVAVKGLGSAAYTASTAYAAASHTHNYAGSSSAGGAANSAVKLSTARSIALTNDFNGSANFDGSANISISSSFYSCSVNGGNKANYPYHRIAYITGKTGNYSDNDAILLIRQACHGGAMGIIKISLRTNGSGGACNSSATWLCRWGYSDASVVIAHWGITGQSVYSDVFLKCSTYPRTQVYQLVGSRIWTLVNSNEVNDTTTTDKKTSTEVYTTVAAAGTEIHNQAYTTTSNSADSGVAYKSDISTLQSNFQAGVDSVYNAIKAQGTTPASKSLSDVVTGIGTMSTNRYNAGTTAGYSTKRSELTGTYTPSSNGSKLDMGSNHKMRYVNTNTVYNAGTAAGYNTKVGQLTGTYTPTGSGGSKLDMGSNHNQRYVNTNTVYNTGTAAGYNSGTTAGYNAKRAELTGTYTPTGSGGSKLDMGSNHKQRYVNTNTVYNTGTTNGYNTKVGQLTATYTPSSNGSKLDMGSNHNNRYVNTNTVYNAGTTAGYNTKKNQLTGTYTPTSRASNLDMGADHKYRYVNTNSVPNTNSTTYNLNRYRGLIDLGATNKYRYINANMEPIVWGDGKETSTSKKITFTATSYDSFLVVISNQTGASRTCTCSSSSVSIEEFAGSNAFCNVFLVYNSGSSDQTVTISSSAQPWTYSIMELDY